MRMRVKLVPDDEPNADGRWVSRKIPGGTTAQGIWKMRVGQDHIVSYRRPFRSKAKKHRR